MPLCFYGLYKESEKVRICAGLLFYSEELCVCAVCAKIRLPSTTDAPEEKLSQLPREHKGLNHTKLSVYWSDYKRKRLTDTIEKVRERERERERLTMAHFHTQRATAPPSEESHIKSYMPQA